MRRERSVGSRANLELAHREVARPGAQMRGGISLTVPLVAVALRTVLEIELLARLPLRIGPDVGSRCARRNHQRGTPAGDQDGETRAHTDPAGDHFFAPSSLARGLRPVKS